MLGETRLVAPRPTQMGFNRLKYREEFELVYKPSPLSCPHLATNKQANFLPTSPSIFTSSQNSSKQTQSQSTQFISFHPVPLSYPQKMHSPLLLATLSLFLTFTGITLAAPAPAPAPVSVALDKRAYSVCCQDIVGGDLTLGTGTAFDCTSYLSPISLSCFLILTPPTLPPLSLNHNHHSWSQTKN